MLKIEDLQLTYGDRKLFTSICLKLAPGISAVLKGANGSGKTTILNCISGVIPEYIKATLTGSITLHGTDLRQIPLKEKFRYLWYSPADFSNRFFFPTCEAELAFALENLGMPKAELRQRIDAALARFGLQHELWQAPQTLSAGQQNLLQCAMAEALDPPLYLLDEPARGLADSSLKLLCDWIADLKARSRIVLFAEHHPLLLSQADTVFDLDSCPKYDQD